MRIFFLLMATVFSMSAFAELDPADEGQRFYVFKQGRDTLSRFRFEKIGIPPHSWQVIGYIKLESPIDGGDLVRFTARISKLQSGPFKGYFYGLGRTSMTYADGTICEYPIKIVTAKADQEGSLYYAKAWLPAQFPVYLGEGGQCRRDELFTKILDNDAPVGLFELR